MNVCPHPEECCEELTRVWAALGITEPNGLSASENVTAMRHTCEQQAQEIARLTALARELAIQVGERDELINRLRLQLQKCEAGR